MSAFSLHFYNYFRKIMVREIINVYLGQSGTQIGSKFWKDIANEHFIDENGNSFACEDQETGYLDIFFDQSVPNRYIPRAVFGDLEPTAIDRVRGSSYGGLYRPDNFIYKFGGSGNNWAIGRYGDKAQELVSEMVDILRKEAESCDALEGIQIAHALGGGSGSGMMTSLTSEFFLQFCGKFLNYYTIFPSRQSENVIEPLNSILSLSTLIDYTEAVYTFDNDSLYEICGAANITNPTYDDLNTTISNVMSGLSCSLRFPGSFNTNMRKIAVNIVPYGRLHFLVNSYNCIAKINLDGENNTEQVDYSKLTEKLFYHRNIATQCDLREGVTMASAVVYRGYISPSEVGKQTKHTINKYYPNFFRYMKNPHITTSICYNAVEDIEVSATAAINSTVFKTVFQRILHQTETMLKKSAYIHHYLAEGLDYPEMTENIDFVKEMIQSYEYEERIHSSDEEEVDDDDSD
ncbi:Tubulin beta chain, nucleomorph [Tritrichomonas foetus]|uniref:Tubulin beta chain, nucleomorph n=1 Tax=Tritrichomonas foetus TaxID=1144522 RepID=A0A1J4JFJ1_9EUKA|nr:Tubulin beta chain, nucleomorph [Tritrichomonas foetus]|eukprot:OHS96229.1 Tubulin beta chain, nucleomorph [Tritrichomonas foetus]